MTQRYSSTILISTLLAFNVVAHASQALVASNRRESIRVSMKERGVDTTANYVLDSILTRPKVSWRRADLPPKLRSRVRFIASLVPPFPHDDPRLMDPQNWPASMTVDGALCSLTVYVSDGNHRSWNRSVKDSATTGYLAMYYTDPGVDYHTLYIRWRGPFYDWFNGRLRTRSWTTRMGSRSRIREYWPYPSGELFTFEEFDKTYNAEGWEISSDVTEEAFARNGSLIGCSDRRSGNFPLTGYWMGVSVGGDYVYRWTEALERSLEQH